MIKSLKLISKDRKIGKIPKIQGHYHSYIKSSEEKKMIKLFPKYIKKFT